MIGSELKNHPDYLLNRAQDRLAIKTTLGSAGLRLAGAYVGLFGIPEIGTQIRICNVLRQLPKDVGDFIDIGTGAGMLLAQVRQRRRWRRLVGIDSDGPSLEVARHTHPYASFQRADVSECESAFRGQFDVAACIDVLEYVPQAELAAFVEHCAAMLKPNALFIVHVPRAVQFRHFRKFAAWRDHNALRTGFFEQELRNLLEPAGFVDAQIFPSISSLTELAWEINMLMAATPLQALLFPLLMCIAFVSEHLPFKRSNALIAVARRP